MNLPIIFVHKTNPLYLGVALSQAKRMNPNGEVILLGDYSNQDYSGVHHYFIHNYCREAEEFANHYIHHSPNPFDYELFCFQRWFVIHEFIKRSRPDIKRFLYLDSDAMLFTKIDEELTKWMAYKMTLTGDGGPCYTFFNDGVLDEFVQYINNVYTTKNGIKQLEEYAHRLKEKNKNYGISDMSSFMVFHRLYKDDILSLEKIDNDSCYLHNINDPSYGFLFKNGYIVTKSEKKNFFAFSTKENKWLRLKGIHFQGGAKDIMYKYLPLRQKVLAMIRIFLFKLSRKIQKVL